MANYQYQYGGYPTYQNGYQQQNQISYQQPQVPQQPQIQPQVQNTGILYVDGDKGAEEFQMFPNTFAFLKSTDGKAVYFKQALANGSITCDKYVLGTMQTRESMEFITRAEFDEFVKSLSVKEKNYDEQQPKYAKNNERTSKLQDTDAKSRNN